MFYFLFDKDFSAWLAFKLIDDVSMIQKGIFSQEYSIDAFKNVDNKSKSINKDFSKHDK